MDEREAALQFLRTHGPSLPSAVAKHLGTSILIASAVLSDLSAQGRLKVSKLKVGGSPVYYLNGQEGMLEKIFYPRLNAKDKKTYDLLKNKKLLKNDELNPLTRVSLQNIKDFAIPFSVNAGGKKMFFWKWFLLSDTELKGLLDDFFGNKKEEQEEKEFVAENNEEDKEKVNNEKSGGEEGNTAENDKKESPVVQKTLFKPLNLEHRHNEKPPEMVGEKVLVKKKVSSQAIDSSYLKKVIVFLEDNNCLVDNIVKVSKREFELSVNMITNLGSIKLLVYVWEKKRLTDADISKVFVKAQLLKVQGVVISPADLTKKAILLLPKLNLVFKQLR